MVSQPIWIAIVIGVFFVGIGISYAHFASTYDPMSMKFQNQELFDQMMSNNPRMSQQWMDSGMMNQQQMMNDPQMMNQWMNSMMSDPQMQQQMMNTIMQHQGMMTSMMNNQDMMNMMDSGMNQGMMGNSMMGSSITDKETDALKSQIEMLQQKISQYELEQEIVQRNLDLFDELDLIAFNDRDMERIAEIHMPDVKVINRDGSVTEPFDPNHKDELDFLFTTFPDFSINEHPIGFGQGEWTAGMSISTGTFLNPMKLSDGTVIEPTGESFEIGMVTLAKWKDGRIVEEYLFWDNEDWMRQIGVE